MQIGILVFDEVEELDFIGPLEVFGVAGRVTGQIDLCTLSKDGQPIRGRYGLHVLPDHSFANCPVLDFLLVPGGKGAREQARYDGEILAFVQSQAQLGRIASVCTGSLVLAEAGLLAGRQATTHWAALDFLRAFPGVQVIAQARYVHDGGVSTSGGISAGMDLALSLVGEWFGDEVARQVAHIMEYSPVASTQGYPKPSTR